MYALYAEALGRVEEAGDRPDERTISRKIERLPSEGGGNSVGAMRYNPTRSEHVAITRRQLGRKFGKHAPEWGIDFDDPDGQERFTEIIEADDIGTGDWWDQPSPCTFYKKGDDLVVVNALDEFVTVMKGGASNARYQRAVGRIGD